MLNLLLFCAGKDEIVSPDFEEYIIEMKIKLDSFENFTCLLIKIKQ
jgi:hypothetical protein